MDSFGQNRSRKSGSGKDDELKKLLAKSGKITSQDFLKLKSLYNNDELVDELRNSYVESQGNLSKKAKKFAQLIREKYSDSQTPFHILLEKAYKYKVKYGLSDSEFAEFQRIYEQELVGNKSLDLIQPATNVEKVLGGISLDFNGFASRLDGEDKTYMKEIIRLDAASKPLHAQVLLQSLKYKDLDFEAVSGVYDRNLHRIGEHIHPVVAALFLPKLNVIENHFLYASISNIIKSRHNGDPLTSRPDYELFFALTTDPNDVVCDNKSTVLDLLNRAQLQVQLWNCVLHLRNGQYYNASFKDFMASVDLCRLNKQDTPDLVYGRYDGVILKRLLSAFSFRPTMVSVTPAIVNPVAVNPYSYNIRPQVTGVPMINMRLPPALSGTGAPATPIKLDSALNQFQLFIEGGQIVPRNTNLIWSRGVLIFYVDRRSNVVKINNHIQQFSMGTLPTPIAGFERINTSPIAFPPTMTLSSSAKAEDTFKIRSVVFSEVNVDASGNKTKVVIGSSAWIKQKVSPEYILCYDPYAPLLDQTQPNRSVMTSLKMGGTTNPDGDAKELAEKYGNIFIYGSDMDIYATTELDN
jgi:hypothetical protein